LKKLQLNDAALVFEPESSEALAQVLGVGSWGFFIWTSLEKGLKEN